MIWPPLRHTLFPYTTLFRSIIHKHPGTKKCTKPKGVPCAREIQAPGFENQTICGVGPSFRASGNLNDARPSRHGIRSEEHTSELQSHSDLVCRLLLEKKKIK